MSEIVGYYIGLVDGVGQEPGDPAYERQFAEFDAQTGESLTNIAFPAATRDWGEIHGCALYTQREGGWRRHAGPMLPRSVVVLERESLECKKGKVQIHLDVDR